MKQRISPARAITGAITLPGDKSISHRYAMISAIADGESRIHNYSTGADCHSTLRCVRALGIDVEVAGTEVRINGDRKSTRLNSSHLGISYAVFCLKKTAMVICY